MCYVLLLMFMNQTYDSHRITWYSRTSKHYFACGMVQVRRWITLPFSLRGTHGAIPPYHDRILRLCRLGAHTLRGLEPCYRLHRSTVSSLWSCDTGVSVTVYGDWLDTVVDSYVRFHGICHEWLRCGGELRE